MYEVKHELSLPSYITSNGFVRELLGEGRLVKEDRGIRVGHYQPLLVSPEEGKPLGILLVASDHYSPRLVYHATVLQEGCDTSKASVPGGPRYHPYTIVLSYKVWALLDVSDNKFPVHQVFLEAIRNIKKATLLLGGESLGMLSRLPLLLVDGTNINISVLSQDSFSELPLLRRAIESLIFFYDIGAIPNRLRSSVLESILPSIQHLKNGSCPAGDLFTAFDMMRRFSSLAKERAEDTFLTKVSLFFEFPGGFGDKSVANGSFVVYKVYTPPLQKSKRRHDNLGGHVELSTFFWSHNRRRRELLAVSEDVSIFDGSFLGAWEGVGKA